MMRWVTEELASVLKLKKVRKQIKYPADEKLISVQLYGRGAVQRVVSPEKAPKPFIGYVGREGQLVYSRIWARKGAIAKITNELDGVVVTNEFPLFDVLPSADIDFLLWCFRTPSFIRQLELAGTGTSGQNRIKEKDFLKLSIPLPPLNEQKRIAEILGGVADCLTAVQTEIDNVEALTSSLISRFADDRQTMSLDELAVLSGGLSLGSHRKSKPITARYLRVANVFWGKISYEEIKELQCTEQELQRTVLRDGDIVITEAHANRRQVGRSAVIRNCTDQLVFQNHLFRARPIEGVDSDVLAAMLSSFIVRRQLYQMAKTTSGLNTISISQVRSLKVPVLTDSEQVELQSCLQELDCLRQLLHQKLTLLQELQRSLSARAFAGQL